MPALADPSSAVAARTRLLLIFRNSGQQSQANTWFDERERMEMLQYNAAKYYEDEID